MVKKSDLPFKVGQVVEARCFEPGYRGAWFRCKISEISWRNGHIGHLLEYFDFPEEKLEWVCLYQDPAHPGRPKKKRTGVLMVRPSYPPVYRDNQKPCVSDTSEVAVIIGPAWKVGDLVDWWCDDCFWSGKITRLLGDDKAELVFGQPPLGEGLSYEVFFKDLRPSLDWSPEYGWTVPTRVGEIGCPGSQLVELADQDAGKVVAGLLLNASPSSCSPVKSLATRNESKGNCSREVQEPSSETAVPKEVSGTKEIKIPLDIGDGCTRRTPLPDADSSSCLGEIPAETPAEVAEDDLQYSSCPLKKYRASGGMALNSMRSDTLEATMMDLEEVANKLKWLKSMLNFGIPLPNAARPRWEFVEPTAPPPPPPPPSMRV